MSLPESVITTLRECSRDEAAFQRLLTLVEPSFNKDLSYDRILAAHYFAERITATIPDIVYVYDLREARNVYVNQEIAHWLGYSSDEIQAMGDTLFATLMHPDDLAALPERNRRFDTLDAGEFIATEYRMRHKDGKWRWLSSHDGVFKRDAEGNTVQILGIAQDITERKQAHDALAESEARYRSVVTTMSEGIVVQDVNGVITTCNAAAQHILGLTLEQMTGRTSIDARWRAIHEDFTPFPGETHPAMVALRTGNPVLNVIMGIHKPDDTLTWILVNAQPLFQPGDVQPYAVVASFTDITQIRQMEAALQQSEARLRSIFETIDDGVWSMELPGNQISYLNPAGERMLGRTSAAFRNNGELRLKIVHPDDLPRLMAAFENATDSGYVDIEYRVLHPDDSIRWVHSRAWHIYDREHRAIRVEGILRDITERKLLEQQQVELQIERERVKLLSSFITNTSHELRTPLTVIGMNIHIMGRIDDREARKVHAARAQEQIKHLNTMITQLHDMAKLDQLQEIEREPIVFEQWINDTISQQVIKKRGVRIQTDIAAALPRIQGDAEYLKIALMQLIENAVQFSPEGAQVTVCAALYTDEVVVEVQDHGAGIPTEHLAHIFDHFYKVDAARTYRDSGAGMGLTIVRRVMQLHGGSVSVESEVGKGTTFRLHLPVK
jgi:PAS domain S-box-containing protein